MIYIYIKSNDKRGRACQSLAEVTLLVQNCRGDESKAKVQGKRKADAEQKSTKKSKFFEEKECSLSFEEQKSIETVKAWQKKGYFSFLRRWSLRRRTWRL